MIASKFASSISLCAGMIALATSCRGENDSKLQAVDNSIGDRESSYHSELSMRELMTHVIYSSANRVWERQGFIFDANGERSLFPKSDEEWERAEEAAATLAELSHILLAPARAYNDEEWRHYVIDLRNSAIESMHAAERHDQDTFFQAGGKLYEACESCHKEFLPEADPSVMSIWNSVTVAPSAIARAN